MHTEMVARVGYKGIVCPLISVQDEFDTVLFATGKLFAHFSLS